ncbi:MAG: peptidoglycan DD-metalloendopeptidase family protein [Goleter apudmare HA4340-LM2]|jgi:murein DD-endopeptidase MepM/ murein hydrolase activator NlpD|nr:peptidoglycan DD-metalloendopeptidase family protein [Goleter apudmare HA4340-LM2]
MTQPNKSAHNGLQNQSTKRFASTLPAQSLCWLSSFSLLSGGFVFAQTETSIDNIVPTIENSQPTAATNPVKQNTAAPQLAQPQPEFSERQTRLRKRLNSKSASTPEPVRLSKPQVETAPIAPSNLTEEKPKQEVAKPISPRTLPEKLPEVARPATNSNSGVSATGGKTKDYNNAYIDPTNYNPNAASGYQAPNSVIITERSSGCQATLPTGQAGALCAKTPASSADAKPAPSWLRRSQNTQVASVTPIRRPVVPVSNSGWRGTRVASSSPSNRVSSPSRFIPNPSDFSATKVSATPIAPSGGALPAPMAEGNIAPRPSTESYDFPLAAALPQIPYTGTIAYRGTGMIYPLTVPSPITSLFGWRIHPITGDRRFHAGTDLGAPTGTPILAAAKGQVQTADWQGGYGLAVIINHGSAQQTLYAHMSEVFVQPGQQVEPGTVIGRVGSTGNSTGPHLHFEVRHLTPEGWVATDPGVELQTALNQLIQALRTAQVNQQPGS